MLKQTINHIGIVVASKVMPLASLLIYSRFLTPAEFGVVSLFYSYIWILGIVLTLNLHTGIGRFIYDKNFQNNELIGTTLLSVGSLFGIGIFAVLFFHTWIASTLNLPTLTLPLLIAVVAGQVAESLLLQIFTARDKSGSLLVVVMIRTLGSVIVTIPLLWFVNTEKYIIIISVEALFSVLLVAYLIFGLRGDSPWNFSLYVLRTYCGYCIPLIPYMLGLTLLSQFDRVMLDHFVGKKATGLYSVGYNLGIVVVMISSALLGAFNPRFFKDMDGENYDAVRQDAYAVFVICVFFAFSVALFGPYIASLLIPVDYSEGFALIPLVALGGLVSVVFQIWGRIIGYFNKTYLLSVAAVIATVIKIALNMVTISIFGLWGCAFTTLLAYGFMASFVIIVVNRVSQSLHINFAREILWLCALAVVVGCEFYINKQSINMFFIKLFIIAFVAKCGWKSVRDSLLPKSRNSTLESDLSGAV